MPVNKQGYKYSADDWLTMLLCMVLVGAIPVVFLAAIVLWAGGAK